MAEVESYPKLKQNINNDDNAEISYLYTFSLETKKNKKNESNLFCYLSKILFFCLI